MGRRPEPKANKIARGTYRPDRDKSMEVALADEAPPMPDSLGDDGKQFWGDAYAEPWVTASDRTMVLLIARKLDERQVVAAQVHQSPVDESRKHRTLKEIDRDIASGLDQLLLTPNSRRRAGIETADPSKDAPSKLQELMERRANREEQREQLERISEANTSRIEALMDPDGVQRRRNGLS